MRDRNALDKRSIDLRKQIIDIMAESRKGHIRSAFSCLEIVRVLYDDILWYHSDDPKWDGRDRFVMSKGHGCLAQYVLLADKGFFPKKELTKFCKDGALLGGHPRFEIPGIEVATGSLGHGLPIGVGFALVGKRTFVLVGDGECNEGSIWEAAMCASKHNLKNLTVLIDRNKQQSYGTTQEVLPLESLSDKWRAFGFAVKEIDGHSIKELRETLTRVPFEERPTAIICHTVKGKGIKLTEDNLRWHYKIDITDEEIKDLYRGLNA